MAQAKALSHEIRERLPRIILDFISIIVTLLVAYIVLPIAYAINLNMPVVGLSIGLAVGVIFLVILAILVVRILRDTTVLTRLSSHALSKAVSGLEEHQEHLIRKVARDFASILVILILFYVLAPFVVMIPGVGASLAAAIPIVLAAIVIIFLYDASRLMYQEVSKVVHKMTEKIASIVEESERK